VDKAGSWAGKEGRPAGSEDEITLRVGRGRLLGRYRLLQLIRRGRRTELYRAERSGEGTAPAPCAVKIPRAGLETSLDVARELSHEIQILSQLDHPNVVGLEDHGNVAGSIFLTLEFLEGRSVSQLLHALSLTGGWMPADVAAHVAAEIALALHHVHEASIGSRGPSELVHRDVRPGHVILLRSGAIKLIDFGAARSADRRLGRRRTELDLQGGAASYLAPEQVQGHPVDRRADLFSLGVVLWEMLAQRRLFRRDTDQDTASAVMEGPIPTLASLRSDIPAALEVAVRRALERDPQRRYQTAQEMASDLARCTPGREPMARGVAVLVEATMDVGLSGSSPLSRPEQERARAAGPSRRSAVPSASAAEKTAMVRRGPWDVLDRLRLHPSRMKIVRTGVLALLGFAAGALWQKHRQEPPRIEQVAPAALALPPPRAVVEPIGAAARPAAEPPPPSLRIPSPSIGPPESGGRPRAPAPKAPSRRRSSGRPR
jgi:eukaryotic-like serine/threonine-protein kinase